MIRRKDVGKGDLNEIENRGKLKGRLMVYFQNECWVQVGGSHG